MRQLPKSIMKKALLIALIAGSFYACKTYNEDLIEKSLAPVGIEHELLPMGQEVYQLRKKYLQTSADHHAAILEDSVVYFHSLYEWSQVYRIHIKRLAQNVENNEGPLPGKLIQDLARVNNDFALLRQELYTLLKNHSHYRDNKYGQWKQEEYVKGLCLNLAVTVTLYDNVSIAMKLLDKYPEIKHLFLNGSVDYHIPTDFNRQVVKAFQSSRRRHLVRDEMEKFEDAFAGLEVTKLDKGTEYLAMIIANSASAQRIREGNVVKDFSKSAGSRLAYYGESLFRSHEKVLFHLSKGFGNSLGLVETRKGYLHNDDGAIADLKKQLKPLDILLEKTPFRLTDKFIPGHFGHVAIYIGTEKELKVMGLWEHPLIKPHQQEIRQGKTVLEALRKGVVLNTVEHFMNVDDLAVLRRNKLNGEKQQEYTLNAFRQIGKEYDFCFDVETLNKIVCSELVYQVFTDDKFGTAKALGRATISPDLVVEKVFGDRTYEIVLFYHEGKRVEEKQLLSKVKALMNDDDI